MKCSRIFLMVLLLAPLPLRAQIVSDGASATLANVTNNIPGTVTVGTNGAFTRLVLSDNALLTNSGHGVISRNLAARSNEVQLIRPTARWRMGGTLFVGSNGANASLIVSNGAFVDDGSASFGFRLESSNNTALVTDPGSVWSNRFGLDIGGLGRGNQLIVSNGGAVFSRTARLGVDASSISNLAVVTGSGSVWSNATSLAVGNIAPGNRLVIEAGGRVVSDSGVVGDFGSASNNLALVTGPGSLWTNLGSLIIGSQMGFNRLIVSNGAAVRSGSGTLGASLNNKLVVTGNGSIWSNAAGLFLMNRADVTDGGWLACSDGYLASSNSVVTLSGASGWNNLGTLRVGDSANGTTLIASNGATVLSSNALIGSSASLGNNNLVLLTGAGTLWSNRTDLTVGNFGAGNRLVVSNGARVKSLGFDVGANAGSDANDVRVTGPGSELQADVVIFGQRSRGNRLTIDNGGRVRDFAGNVGSSASDSNNLVIVDGAGSSWSNSFAFQMGGISGANRLIVTNGGVLQDGRGTFGEVSDDNQAWVTGPGSLWQNLDSLTIGSLGLRNLLVVSNGAVLAARTNGIFLGEHSFKSANRMVVGDGTLLATNESASAVLDLRVGASFFNGGLMDVDRLRMTNRGVNLIPNEFGSSGTVTIPSGSPAAPYPSSIAVSGLLGNITKVSVTLSNLSHTFPDDLDILLVSPTGQKVMLMSDAGSVNPATPINNVKLTFDDAAPSLLPDSTLIVSGAYRPTDYQPGETMPNPAPPGLYSTSLSSFNGNTPNGTWKLYINDDQNPDSGSLAGWTLQILTDADPALAGVFQFNGGTLITRGASISNALPFIVGAGGTTPALWDVRAGAAGHFIDGPLLVGSNASFAQVVITNGAALTNTGPNGYCFVGWSAGNNSNSVTLAGPGTRWELPDGIRVGNFGSFNRLVVSNGAALSCDSYCAIGHQFVASNNEATVTGPGSVWNLNGFASQLFIGAGRGNRLVVSDGGQVFSDSGAIGPSFTDSSNNLAVVTGAGSIWSNAADLRVGDIGPANQLVVSNGGTVFAGGTIYEGFAASALNSRVTVDGGTLRVINAAATGLLDVRRGFFTLNSGLVEVDRLQATNSATFAINGGTVSARSSSFAFSPDVGNGTTPATYFLAGNGTHDLPGLVVRAGSTLAGNGTINGPIVTDAVLPLGVISPGPSFGKIVLNNSPTLNGLAFMEISKNGSTLTNDQIQVNAALRYRGTLTVTNVGPTPLAPGDQFKLFPATSYSGAFVTMNLPPLPPGLSWANKLLVDGSIEVVTVPTPGFADIARSGTNIVFSGTNGTPGANYTVLAATNVALPASNWTSIATRQFDAGGGFTFTNAIAPGIPQSFFRLRAP